jgi:hypothetical protein
MNTRHTTGALKDFYTEAETVEVLGISIQRLHSLLDEHIFNDGSIRPAELTFTSVDVTLLGFWSRSTENPKVVRMPKR